MTHRERHKRPLQTQLHAAARSVGQPASWKPLPSPLRLGTGSLSLLFLLGALHHPLRCSYPIPAFVKSLYQAHSWSDVSCRWAARTLFRPLVFTLHRDMLDALALQNISFHPQWLPDLASFTSLSFMRTPPNSVSKMHPVDQNIQKLPENRCKLPGRTDPGADKRMTASGSPSGGFSQRRLNSWVTLPEHIPKPGVWGVCISWCPGRSHQSIH